MKLKNGVMTMIMLFVLKSKFGVDGLLLFAFINGKELGYDHLGMNGDLDL
jgi:hypothetical protein